MLRIRFFLLGVVAILAFGTIASAGAMAETNTCEEVSGTTALCLLEGEALVPSTSATVVNFTSEAEPGVESLLEVPGLWHIECKKIIDAGFFMQGTLLVTLLTGSVTIEFKECEALEPNHACKVTFGRMEAQIVFPGPDDEKINFKPEEANKGIFTTLTLTGGECLIAGKYEIAGEVTCTLTKALEDLVTHDILCTHENKGLVAAKKPITLEIEDLVTLETKAPWSVDIV